VNDRIFAGLAVSAKPPLKSYMCPSRHICKYNGIRYYQVAAHAGAGGSNLGIRKAVIIF